MPEQQPPAQEMRLIQLARSALGLSPEKAVKRMTQGKSVSGRHWRLLERGNQIGQDDTVAHMAYAVGVRPAELEEAGRHDAAEILRFIESRASTSSPSGEADLADPKERSIAELETLTLGEKIDHIAKLRVNRVASDLRAENEELRQEVARLRTEIAELRRSSA